MAKETVAVIFGTFAPMHKGHLDLIARAKAACGQACVVVSGSDGDRGAKIGLDLHKRYVYAQEQFAADDAVVVRYLDETDLPPYPIGWKEWLERLLALLDLHANQEPIFYVSEEEYAQELEKRGYRAAFTPRKFGLSATLIREHPSAHLADIAPAFRPFFDKA